MSHPRDCSVAIGLFHPFNCFAKRFMQPFRLVQVKRDYLRGFVRPVSVFGSLHYPDLSPVAGSVCRYRFIRSCFVVAHGSICGRSTFACGLSLGSYTGLHRREGHTPHRPARLSRFACSRIPRRIRGTLSCRRCRFRRSLLLDRFALLGAWLFLILRPDQPAPTEQQVYSIYKVPHFAV